MEILRGSKRRSHGNDVFHIDILYPGIALGLKDTGYKTIGRIDHASFRPPGVVPMHPHQDDEILSYVRSGLQIHRDSTGHKEYISDSYMMLMNAGSGIEHEESAEKDIEMLQIFMRPYKNGLPPQVQFHQFEAVHSVDQWRLVAGDAESAPLKLRTETNILDARMTKDTELKVPLAGEKVVNFLYCFSGSITIGNEKIAKGDSAIFNNEEIRLVADTQSDLVLFQINEDARYSDTGMYSGNQYKR